MVASIAAGGILHRIIGPRFTDLIRAGEWWEFKLVPIFAAFYATALTLDVPLLTLWRTAITVLLALVPGAIYVSVINDLTDRDEDLAAGKRNRFAQGRSAGLVVALLTAAAGIWISFLWREQRLLVTFYLAAWLAFSLYSLPPFRWKTRGLAGVLCDATGAHLFPTLVAVMLVYRDSGREPDPVWLLAVSGWALANGLRGILWHQLTDLENDRRSGIRTFATTHSTRATVRLGSWIAFPVELLAFAVILWKVGSVWPVLILLGYVQSVRWRVYSWRMRVVIVEPRDRFLIAMHEYYDVYFPLTLLALSAFRHPGDFILLAVHVVLFPMRTTQTLRDVGRLLRDRYFTRYSSA